MNSLRARVIAAASLVLAAALGVTGIALERAFRETGMELVHERLQAQLYSLLAAANPDASGGLGMDVPPEPRFSLPDSGLYALVREPGGSELWRSRSLLDRSLVLPEPARAGIAHFDRVRAPWGEQLFSLAYRVRWEMGAGRERVLDLHVAESRREFDSRVARFRRDLWVWLAGLAAGLLAAQALVLTRGLAPLQRLAGELRGIESGARAELSEDQPRELRVLAANMNHLIRFGRRIVDGHRNALADLAHALKTPMAVLRGAAEDAGPGSGELPSTVIECVARMDEALSYRLRRASPVNEHTLPPAVEVAPLAARLCDTLRKVYAGKHVAIELEAAPQLVARADPGDLTEILGNLVDNACKWARARVYVTLDGGTGGDGLLITVEDDGPGIAPEQRTRILERGARADELTPGQGIGLAVVHDLVVHQYRGSIEVDESARGGGARIQVRLDVPAT